MKSLTWTAAGAIMYLKWTSHGMPPMSTVTSDWFARILPFSVRTVPPLKLPDDGAISIPALYCGSSSCISSPLFTLRRCKTKPNRRDINELIRGWSSLNYKTCSYQNYQCQCLHLSMSYFLQQAWCSSAVMSVYKIEWKRMMHAQSKV